jgi:hypothetical protein
MAFGLMHSACTPPDEQAAQSRELVAAGNAKLTALREREEKLAQKQIYLDPKRGSQFYESLDKADAKDRESNTKETRQLLNEYIAFAEEVQSFADRSREVKISGLTMISAKALYAKQALRYLDMLGELRDRKRTDTAGGDSGTNNAGAGASATSGSTTAGTDSGASVRN